MTNKTWMAAVGAICLAVALIGSSSRAEESMAETARGKLRAHHGHMKKKASDKMAEAKEKGMGATSAALAKKAAASDAAHQAMNGAKDAAAAKQGGAAQKAAEVKEEALSKAPKMPGFKK